MPLSLPVTHPHLIADHIAGLQASPLARWAALAPWVLTTHAVELVGRLFDTAHAADHHVADGVVVHRSATVETGAVLKGPLFIGPGCFIAAGAYLRGGCWLEANCIIGPGAELKSSFVFAGSKLAHFNFVGDAVLGHDVNLEAGSIVCNYRNEHREKTVQARIDGRLQSTGVDKFGALIGDHSRIGANAVLAPGAVLAPHTVVRRGALCDPELD